MVALSPRIAAAALAAAGLFPSIASSQDEADFYKAYYLEHELGDLSAARALYAEVASDRDVPTEMRSRADHAAKALAEDIASSDFTRLVPRDVLFYAELSRPGEELSMLLSSLGLLGKIEEGSGLGISPALVDGLLGMRGAAVAVTSFDPRTGPKGVLLLHPGELDVVRGLIETALPAAGQPEAPIGGFPTWSIEGQAYATLTNRLVVAGTDRGAIEGVLARMRGEGGPSLAENEALDDVIERGRDGLLSFCVNAEPLMPMITQMLGQQAAQDPEAAMMLAFLDVKSLRSVSGFLDVDPDGVNVELALELAEGHRNLAFNLLRMPGVEKATLKRIPSGAAFFVALGLNPSGGAAPIARDAQGQPIVSFMDFGREVFGNVRDLTVYGMPADGAQGIPNVAVELRVNDVERSLALWDFALGTATGASGGGAAQDLRIAGHDARAYSIEGLPIFVAARDDGIVVSPSRATIEHALSGGDHGASILNDPVFAADVKRISKGHPIVAMVNPGRAIEFASGMMSPRDLEEAAPIAELLRDTVVTIGVEHTDTRLAFRARVSSLPDVSDLVAEQLRGGREDRVAVSVAPATPIAASAPNPIAKALGAHGPSPEEQLAKLAASGDLAAAKRQATTMFEASFDDPARLNDLAWKLATEEPFEGKLTSECLVMAERANELTDYGNWYYVDTLALVMFQLGEVKEAVRLERIAVELAEGDPRGGEARDALERFEAALEEVAVQGE